MSRRPIELGIVHYTIPFPTRHKKIDELITALRKVRGVTQVTQDFETDSFVLIVWISSSGPSIDGVCRRIERRVRRWAMKYHEEVIQN
jgi:hypothetical protein